jgi:hypothetical protein
MPPLLLACDADGENGALVLVIALAAFAVWVLLTALIVKTGRDRPERRLLLGVLIGSIVLGPLIIAGYYDGLVGSDSSIGKLVPFLAIPGAIGAVIAHLTRAASPLRAFFIASWGAVRAVRSSRWSPPVGRRSSFRSRSPLPTIRALTPSGCATVVPRS